MLVQIKEYPDYSVSDSGEVISYKHGHAKQLKARDNKGYQKVVLFNEEGPKNFSVHRLVAEAFLGKSDLQVNHKNGIKTDNKLENLEFVTALENQKHAWDMGLKQKVLDAKTGANSNFAKLSSDNVKEILSLKSIESAKSLSNRFQVSAHRIREIWNHQNIKNFI